MSRMFSAGGSGGLPQDSSSFKECAILRQASGDRGETGPVPVSAHVRAHAPASALLSTPRITHTLPHARTSEHPEPELLMDSRFRSPSPPSCPRRRASRTALFVDSRLRGSDDVKVIRHHCLSSDSRLRGSDAFLPLSRLNSPIEWILVDSRLQRSYARMKVNDGASELDGP